MTSLDHVGNILVNGALYEPVNTIKLQEIREDVENYGFLLWIKTEDITNVKNVFLKLK
jgi:hypothetical protein